MTPGAKQKLWVVEIWKIRPQKKIWDQNFFFSLFYAPSNTKGFRKSHVFTFFLPTKYQEIAKKIGISVDFSPQKKKNVGNLKKKKNLRKNSHFFSWVQIFDFRSFLGWKIRNTIFFGFLRFLKPFLARRRGH